MTDKQRAIETISNLPDSATLEDIMAELFFRQKVERGLEDIREGRIVTHEEAKRRLSKWLQQ
jgi:predicted transcriptional regulator